MLGLGNRKEINQLDYYLEYFGFPVGGITKSLKLEIINEIKAYAGRVSRYMSESKQDVVYTYLKSSARVIVFTLYGRDALKAMGFDGVDETFAEFRDKIKEQLINNDNSHIYTIVFLVLYRNGVIPDDIAKEYLP